MLLAPLLSDRGPLSDRGLFVSEATVWRTTDSRDPKCRVQCGTRGPEGERESVPPSNPWAAQKPPPQHAHMAHTSCERFPYLGLCDHSYVTCCVPWAGDPQRLSLFKRKDSLPWRLSEHRTPTLTESEEHISQIDLLTSALT